MTRLSVALTCFSVGLLGALPACMAETTDVELGLSTQAFTDEDEEQEETLPQQWLEVGGAEPIFETLGIGGGPLGYNIDCSLNCLATHQDCSALAGSNPVKIHLCDQAAHACEASCR